MNETDAQNLSAPITLLERWAVTCALFWVLRHLVSGLLWELWPM